MALAWFLASNLNMHKNKRISGSATPTLGSSSEPGDQTPAARYDTRSSSDNLWRPQLTVFLPHDSVEVDLAALIGKLSTHSSHGVPRGTLPQFFTAAPLLGARIFARSRLSVREIDCQTRRKKLQSPRRTLSTKVANGPFPKTGQI